MKMPFHKWIIDSKPDVKDLRNSESDTKDVDLNAIANKRMINAIHHLTQLVKIAGDIFDAIDQECRSVMQRTNSLRIKIQSCQDVVDNLNAKTVPVPVSSLSAFREVKTHFASHHVKDGAPIFCTFPRSPEIERLRELASGPSPPAFIPSYQITLEADGEQRTVSSSSSTTTHIYCQPLPVISNSKKSSSGDSSSTDSIMASQVKVPSSVVPIDVSGQQFSRMASFRRSLIHVDFFIRRKKKKDKRRNTVTEGDTKELKNVLQNIINERSQHALIPNLIFEKNNSKSEINHNSKLQDENNKITSISLEEKNNNSKETCIDEDIKYIKQDTALEERRQRNVSSNGNVKLDLKNHNSEFTKLSTASKRKLKGHIPISTVSAAMSVAVEMRQLNGKNKLEDQSSSGNWSYSSDHNSSDSENKPKSSEMNSENSSYSNSKIYSKNRLKEISSSTKHWNSLKSDMKETEISSGTSSDNNTANDDTTSAESDVFFISSDESDGESSDILEHNYGSSLSLSTVSNGSLNSLLSQTGTEMASSTGTLTSVGIEQLPTPPPSPVIAGITQDETILEKGSKSYPEKQSTKEEPESLFITQVDITKPIKKTKSSQKVSKSSKTEKIDSRKNSEGSKNIFSTLVNMKSRTKEQSKTKPSDKSNSMQNKPLINMYGCSSPKTPKQIPSFIKENISPVMEDNPRKCLQSFSAHQSGLENGIELNGKLKQTIQSDHYEKPISGSTHNTNIKVIDTVPSEPNKIEVPFKYSHKVTVTPIQRQTVHERNRSIVQCKKTLFPENEDQRQSMQNTGFNQKLNKMPHPTDNKIEIPYQHYKPQRPMSLQTGKPKSAARVLLDPEGRVIHCTNSLDRKPHHTVATARHTYNTNSYLQADFRNHGETHYGNKMHVAHGAQIHSLQNSPNPAHTNKINEFNVNYATRNISNATPNTNRADFYGHPCIHAQKSLSEIFRPRSVAENRSNVSSTYFEHANNVPYRFEDISRKGQTTWNPPTVIPPDPNISGLPSSEMRLTQHNVNLHSQKMEKLSIAAGGNNSSDSLEIAPVSPRSPFNEFQKPQQSTMSTEDLFAVIHNCKKRMNIKTNSDISLASSSSRSSSSSFRPVSSKGALAETGFLSPRNPTSNFENSRDRRSWADFRPLISTPNERKSLASDRLGPTKPTSMHDFKMLLLQTRSSNQVLGPRKSAVEMLKVPASQDKTRINSSPLNSSPQCYNSFSVQNSPSSEVVIYNGHSTVPFKRNHRARSSLQSRYTMYPPIFEDCSEDSENMRDNLQNCSGKTTSKLENVDSTQLHFNISRDACKTPLENVRHWL